jgi:hypothetical protein
LGSSFRKNIETDSTEYLAVFIFRKLNKQQNTELLVINPLKLLVNQQEILRLLVSNNQVDKLLKIQLNKKLLLLKLKSEELHKKLPNLNVQNVKFDIHYQFFLSSHKPQTFPISFRCVISYHLNLHPTFSFL